MRAAAAGRNGRRARWRRRPMQVRDRRLAAQHGPGRRAVADDPGVEVGRRSPSSARRTASRIHASLFPNAPPPSSVSNTMFELPRCALRAAASIVASYAASRTSEANAFQRAGARSAGRTAPCAPGRCSWSATQSRRYRTSSRTSTAASPALLSCDGQPGYVALAPTLDGPDHDLPSAARITIRSAAMRAP